MPSRERGVLVASLGGGLLRMVPSAQTTTDRGPERMLGSSASVRVISRSRAAVSAVSHRWERVGLDARDCVG